MRIRPAGPRDAGTVWRVLDGRVLELRALGSWYQAVPALTEMTAGDARRLSRLAAGTMLPVTVIAQNTGKAAGMTTSMPVDAMHRRMEIGPTWHAASVQRSGLNTAAKMLLLAHAFDTLDWIALPWHSARTSSLRKAGARSSGRA